MTLCGVEIPIARYGVDALYWFEGERGFVEVLSFRARRWVEDNMETDGPYWNGILVGSKRDTLVAVLSLHRAGCSVRELP